MIRISKKAYLWSGVAVIVAVASILANQVVPALTASIGSPSKATEGPGDEEKGLHLDEDEIRRAGIKVERLELADRAETIAAFGTVGVNRNKFARVTSPVAGRLVEIDVDLGAQVQAGAVLAALESPELAEVRTSYQQALTELDLARVNLDRSQKLAQDGSIAQKELLRTRSDYERARAALAAIEARLATLKMPAVAPAGVSPAFLTVNSPFAGTVVERTAVLGEYAQAYQALFSVADLSTVWVETNLYDRDLGDVTVGANANVTLSAYPSQRFSGKVTYIGNILDKDTRTAVARIEVANADGLLKPGLFANVEIDKAQRRPVLRVPDNALVLLQGQMTAFVLQGHGFEPRPVEVGERNGGMVIVKSGLEAGDEVVVSGAYALKAKLLKSQIGDGH